jgi:hypothetical protein
VFGIKHKGTQGMAGFSCLCAVVDLCLIPNTELFPGAFGAGLSFPRVQP